MLQGEFHRIDCSREMAWTLKILPFWAILAKLLRPVPIVCACFQSMYEPFRVLQTFDTSSLEHIVSEICDLNYVLRGLGYIQDTEVTIKSVCSSRRARKKNASIISYKYSRSLVLCYILSYQHN